MNRYLVTYDLKSTIPDPHSAFLKHAERLGWSSWVEVGEELLQLPNTTLKGAFPTREHAEAAFDSALDATRAELRTPVILTSQYLVATPEGGLILPRNKKPKYDFLGGLGALKRLRM